MLNIQQSPAIFTAINNLRKRILATTTPYAFIPAA
jgi:hypothetical protein